MQSNSFSQADWNFPTRLVSYFFLISLMIFFFLEGTSSPVLYLRHYRYAPLTALATKRFRSLIVADKHVWLTCMQLCCTARIAWKSPWRRFARRNQTHDLHKRKFTFTTLSYKIRHKNYLLFIQSQLRPQHLNIQFSIVVFVLSPFLEHAYGRSKFARKQASCMRYTVVLLPLRQK